MRGRGIQSTSLILHVLCGFGVGEVAAAFSEAGFRASTEYLSGLSYRYVASPIGRIALPIYNLLDDWLFRPDFMKPMRPLVLTHGVKECRRTQKIGR